jgi:hypothetical protein
VALQTATRTGNLLSSELGSYVQANVKEQAAAKGWNQTPELQGASERVLVWFGSVLRCWLSYHPASTLPHFMSSSRNETTVASSDGYCTPVVVFNRGVGC